MLERENTPRQFRRNAVSWTVERLLMGLMATAIAPSVACAQSTAADRSSALAVATDDGQAAGTKTDTQQQAGVLPTVSVKATAMPGELPAAYAGGEVARGGSIGVLGTANVMDQPFNTTNYTEQMMQDTQARTLADVVVNNASVRAEQSSGGFGDVFEIRGFDVQATDVALNGLYGMVSASRMPVNLMERVEVLQ
ncbi:MAG TPA: TonB-dependent receptor plug domain-containing protein, partial [Paraburkholderia sp.]|uniref:TonB-dependent receptor plug domain-containing protein n=1 Tax=Paraburkholderia sp. TaxID=1926495 RepID=UPI002B495F79